MKEIRDIKIDMLMGNENPILGIFRGITDGMRVINCDVYNDRGMEFIYYNREREWIFYQDVENGEFWAHYSRYWEILKTEFGLGYKEIQELTKFLVEEALKREVATPNYIHKRDDRWVEEALKREVATPSCMHLNTRRRVEEVLKREVAMPSASNVRLFYQVEEALKRELL